MRGGDRLRKSLLSRHLPPIGETSDASISNDQQEIKSTESNSESNDGMKPLGWDVFFEKKISVKIDDDEFCVYTKGSVGPMFYLLHGGGYSGLTWACLAEELHCLVECRIVAPDLRGHGETRTTNDLNLSVEQQIKDILAIHNHFCDGLEIPTFVIGHSMGGALAIHVVSSGKLKTAVAIGVIDVVEGTAFEALSSMVQFLQRRPQQFKNVKSAIKWCLTSKTTRNERAACVSMPQQIKKVNDHYTWRIDLVKTENHWSGWFKGTSKMFLNCGVPKLLVLAGTDRLDTELMVGQMQGKFQNTILPKVGHAVQEDSPDHLADVLAKFAIRFRFGLAKQS